MVAPALPRWAECRKRPFVGDFPCAEVASASQTKWRFIDMTPDGTKMVAAAQQGGVWVSSDGGTTWTQGLAADHRVYRGAAISDDGMTIVASNCCGGNNWISTDGGASFERINFQINQPWERLALSGDGSTLLTVASGDNGGIWMGMAATTTTTAGSGVSAGV